MSMSVAIAIGFQSTFPSIEESGVGSEIPVFPVAMKQTADVTGPSGAGLQPNWQKIIADLVGSNATPIPNSYASGEITSSRERNGMGNRPQAYDSFPGLIASADPRQSFSVPREKGGLGGHFRASASERDSHAVAWKEGKQAKGRIAGSRSDSINFVTGSIAELLPQVGNGVAQPASDGAQRVAARSNSQGCKVGELQTSGHPFENRSRAMLSDVEGATTSAVEFKVNEKANHDGPLFGARISAREPNRSLAMPMEESGSAHPEGDSDTTPSVSATVTEKQSVVGAGYVQNPQARATGDAHGGTLKSVDNHIANGEGRPGIKSTAVRALDQSDRSIISPQVAASPHVDSNPQSFAISESSAFLRTEPASSDLSAMKMMAEPFAAIDAGQAHAPTTWTMVGAHRAEAGFQDPSIGWVGVRAHGVGANTIHATVVPETAEAAQILGSHIANLNAYVAHESPHLAQISMSSPEIGPGTGHMMSDGQGSAAHHEGQRQPHAGSVRSETPVALELANTLAANGDTNPMTTAAGGTTGHVSIFV
jgi:hypothetical protein